MSKAFSLAIGAGAMILAFTPVAADAQTGARSFGRTISGAMGNKANAVNTVNRQRAQRANAPRHQATSNAQQRGGGVQGALPHGDALAGTDAPTCALDNGSAIRVSGKFRASAAAKCE